MQYSLLLSPDSSVVVILSSVVVTITEEVVAAVSSGSPNVVDMTVVSSTVFAIDGVLVTA